MTRYHVFIQNYADGKIEDKCQATFYTLDDALAYRDWQTSGNPMLVEYVREETESEAYGTPESDEERKRRQKREIMQRYRAKKRAQKGTQEAPGGGAATTLRATPTGKPQTCVSVQLGEDGKPVVFYRE